MFTKISSLRPTKPIIFITLGIILGIVFAYLFFAYMWAYSLTPRLVAQYQGAVPARNLSARQLEIVKRVEDPSFDTNIGMDITTPGQGVTTISQSLARDIYLNQRIGGIEGAPQVIFGTVFKLFKNIDLGRDVMALALHARVPREKLLEMFVERAYMGNKNGVAVYGLGQAAKTYYDREVTELSEAEFITLVAMINSPNDYSLDAHPATNAARAAKIQKLLDGTCAPAGLFDTTYERC